MRLTMLAESRPRQSIIPLAMNIPDHLKRLFEKPERPKCPGCSAAMEWRRSIPLREPVEVAQFFQCPDCKHILEIRREWMPLQVAASTKRY